MLEIEIIFVNEMRNKTIHNFNEWNEKNLCISSAQCDKRTLLLVFHVIAIQ